MFYRIAKKFLFATEPEWAHEKSLDSLRLGHKLGATRFLCKTASLPRECMGLKFPNPIGIAAGLDKNADYFEALGDLGFGFIEVGTITPRPQPGNPKPRVFRIPAAQAMINRLGFNNKGVDYLVENVRNHRFKGILGINIGKNFDTSMDNAAQDYLHCLQKVYAFADYVTVNISSPNTRNLRDLQEAESLNDLLSKLGDERETLADRYGKQVPIAIKVAPDLEEAAIAEIASIVSSNGMDAVIATNTTVTRTGIQGLKHADEAGGLSGRPLKPLADKVLRLFRQYLADETALIGVGGITTGQDAVDKLDCGADLVQFYTGMVYRGPELFGECLEAITTCSGT